MLWVLHALLSHYRRHPVQAVFLLSGVIMANALLLGTQLINAQARASYAQGEQLLNAGPAGQLLPTRPGDALEESAYIDLRLQGFDAIVPLLRRQVQSSDGTLVELVGLDLLAMPRQPGASGAVGTQELDQSQLGSVDSLAFSFPPYQVWGAPARLEQLGWDGSETVVLRSGAVMPEPRALPGQGLGHRLLLDIGALQELTESPGKLSAVLVFTADQEKLARLRDALPAGWRWKAAADNPDPVQLTRSFHLNLAAMGLLAFVVGAFLMFNALAFSYTDRRTLLRKLRLAGLSRATLATALLSELLVFLLLGLLLGGWLGSVLAGLLLPGIGQSLAQLYGVYIAYPDALAPDGFWLPLLMTLLVGGLCALFPLRQALREPLLPRPSNRWSSAAMAKRDTWMGGMGLLLLVLAAGLALGATETVQALAGMACLLLGVALCLPAVLRALLRLASRWVPPGWPRLGWLLADTRWLLGPASLALMAMTLALVANSGLNTMIGSFREATDQWLDRRLAAQIYLREVQDKATLVPWLAEREPEARLIERHVIARSIRNPRGQQVVVEVADLPADQRLLNGIQLLDGEAAAKERFIRGDGVLISERAWRLDGWQTGDKLPLCGSHASVPVLGVYYDYGNPNPQWLVSTGLWQACWPGLAPAGQAIIGPDELDWAALTTALSRELGWQEGDWIDQQALRAVGMAVFDQTFIVTRALNLLTLLVAGIGIFCAVSAIHHHRLGQQAVLATLGLSRRERGGLLLLQWGVLGLFSMVLVWPFGALLAGYLAAVVTPVAFGWSFPLLLNVPHYLILAMTGTAGLLLAVLWPSMRLMRVTPATQLRRVSV